MSIQYKIFEGPNNGYIEDAITSAIKDGWALAGGLVSHGGRLGQAMTREAKAPVVRKGNAPTAESIKAAELEIHGMNQVRADEASKRGITAEALDRDDWHPNAVDIAAKEVLLDDMRQWLREDEAVKAEANRKAAREAADKQPAKDAEAAKAKALQDAKTAESHAHDGRPGGGQTRPQGAGGVR